MCFLIVDLRRATYTWAFDRLSILKINKPSNESMISADCFFFSLFYLFLYTYLRKKLHTPNDVRHSSDENIRATSLHSSTIGIEINVTHWLPRAESSEYQLFTIAVYHVDEISICLVQSSSGILRFEERSSWIQSWWVRKSDCSLLFA